MSKFHHFIYCKFQHKLSSNLIRLGLRKILRKYRSTDGVDKDIHKNSIVNRSCMTFSSHKKPFKIHQIFFSLLFSLFLNLILPNFLFKIFNFFFKYLLASAPEDSVNQSLPTTKLHLQSLIILISSK